ncbi:hypothetical protein CWE15_06475 [Aliidiomarina taiwanensis]|uniref:Uncharacterized protein n=1 Tax=Aliidiomarina taiwanensis TaxID=946228 RepID=A0A432X879_9GAMM|nr:hypothetical protein [Aliidiomarina taiwanensis]RUO43042.1 hypothetical protein CWE15_06475 [Aliidiomarina taiwanensis]
MATLTEKGSVLVGVLALLSISTLALLHGAQVQQQQLQATVYDTHQAELQVYARSILRHAGVMLEQGHKDTEQWQAAWQLPSAIQVSLALQESLCPDQKPGCYQVELILEGRAGTRLERRRHYWAEAGCGQLWE